MNPLNELARFGQSIWLDSISRKLIESGELDRLIADDGVRGVTSNPSIFEKSIGEGSEYKASLASLVAARPNASALELYEGLAIPDIQAAADRLRKVYDTTRARDGYVSLEVTMHAGEDEKSILREARHLWQDVARPNVMIKVPGTASGIAAFEVLIGEGINVNVTLLFSQESYARVASAYVAGLEMRAKRTSDLSRVASVASFFVSRIDTAIDARLTELGAAKELQGKAAIANAKLAYAHSKQVFSGARWQALAAKGAQTQRVLWASTGTKNKAYSDVMYVEELIGEDTVNTAPPATIDAFRDHGRVQATLAQDVEGARKTMAALEKAGISMTQVTDRLLVEGLKLFADAFTKLLATIEAARGSRLPQHLSTSVDAYLDDWKAGDKVRRLWARDARLWTAGDEASWLGWLDAPKAAREHASLLTAFANEIRAEGFTHVVLLGMGGSSLCPEVLKLTFGSKKGFPVLEVVDSTDPAQLATVESRLDLAHTLCIVASKSGSTLEPSIFEQYFFERVSRVVGKEKVGRHFVAITDPGSKLEATARAKGYRKVFAGVPAIGGRFSALSNFGLVPAALIGVDLTRFTELAAAMAISCANPDPRANPGVQLGAILGAAAKNGRDKLTLVLSPAIASLGAWLEQLIAESTGKSGRGVIPVDLEPLAAPVAYGNDRLFVYVRHTSAPSKEQETAVEALERAGHAVVRIDVAEPMHVGAEFFRWEMATAVAGAVIGIHPFDQPDVEASKIETKTLTSAYEKTGSLPAETPCFEAQGMQLFADPRSASSLSKAAGKDAALVDWMRAFLRQAKAGDYVALLAYVEMNAAHANELTTMRREIRDALHLATCVGFGPRFLHSTGQAYKGGPNSGVFLQVTCADAKDLAVPGQKYTFGVVKAAQARGDLAVLVERGRRVLRVHLTGDVRAGLVRLGEVVRASLTERAHAIR